MTHLFDVLVLFLIATVLSTGIFGLLVLGETVKTRLLSWLLREEEDE